MSGSPPPPPPIIGKSIFYIQFDYYLTKIFLVELVGKPMLAKL